MSEEDFGVFIARVELRGMKYYGVLSIGSKKTFIEDGELFIECYIIDFDGEVYGETITVTPMEFIRAQQKFDSLSALKEQITKDVNYTNKKIRKK